MRAYVSLGTNLGDREQNLRDALTALDRLCGTRVTKVSDLFETDPVGYADQPDFLNLCAALETRLSPRALLGACLGIEAAVGRVRTFRNAPRVIDIDLLLYEGVHSDDPELILPHPRMRERAFVLVPLRQILPNLSLGDIRIKTDENIFSDPGVRFYSENAFEIQDVVSSTGIDP